MCVMVTLKTQSLLFPNDTVIEDGRLGPGLAGIKCVDRRNNNDGEERKEITGVHSEFIFKNTDNKWQQKN